MRVTLIVDVYGAVDSMKQFYTLFVVLTQGTPAGSHVNKLSVLSQLNTHAALMSFEYSITAWKSGSQSFQFAGKVNLLLVTTS